MLAEWQRRLRGFSGRAGAPLREGNRVAFHAGGGETLEAQRALIAAAARSVDVEMYIWNDDDTGNGFVDALVGAAARGVRVRAIVDAVGTFGRAPHLARLRAARADVRLFHPVAPWRPNWGWNERNHRKLVLVDDSAAVVTSANWGDEYDSRRRRDGFRDVGLSVAGPVVADVAADFRASWRLTTGVRLSAADPPDLGYALPVGEPVEDVPVQVVSGLVRGDRSALRRLVRLLLGSAETEIVLASAYFVPSRRLVRAFVAAARRGVSVTLLLPGVTDARLVQAATRSTYGRLLRAGVKVYERDGRFLHVKAASVDGFVLSLGSANLDPRSFLHNLELNLNVEHAALAESFRKALDWDFAQSRAVDLAAWSRRGALERFGQHLAYALRYWL